MILDFIQDLYPYVITVHRVSGYPNYDAKIENVTTGCATRSIQDPVESSVSMVSVGLAPVAGTATGLLRKWRSRTK